MMGQDKKRSGRTSSLAIDTIHIVTGIFIVFFAVIAFINPEDNMILFPAIFLLAGLLNLVNGFDKLRSGKSRKKKKASGFAFIALGVGLLLLCVISAITIWWG